MHLIVVPPPVLLINLDTDEPMLDILLDSRKHEATLTKRDPQGNEIYYAPDRPWTQWRMLSKFIFGARQLGKGTTGARHVHRLRKFKDTKPGDIIEIYSATRDAVNEVIKEGEWNSAVTAQLLEHFDAWGEFAYEASAEGRLKADARAKGFLERV